MGPLLDLWAAASYGFYILTGNRKVIGTWRWLKNFRNILQPARSAAMRFRMHTVYGLDEGVTSGAIWWLMWVERDQVWKLAQWVRRMRSGG